MVNLNKEGLYMSLFPYGKTQNVEVRIGCKLYMVDVDKNANSTYIGFYKKVAADRRMYSKYASEADMVSVQVKPDAILTREFFENIREIRRAQTLVWKYDEVLSM